MDDHDEQTRLDKQARVIKQLRAAVLELRSDRDDMKARIAFLETAMGGRLLAEVADQERQPGSASGGPVSDESDIWSGDQILPAVALVDQGTWTERHECLVCGQPKNGKRKAMTCGRCKEARSEAIKSKRKPGIPQCLNCGASKGAGGLLLICAKCRPAARQAGY